MYPLSPEDREIQQRIRRFVDEELIPHERYAEEHGGELPEGTRDRHKQMLRELGFGAINMPKELGGDGLTTFQQVLVSEQIGRVTNAWAGSCTRVRGGRSASSPRTRWSAT